MEKIQTALQNLKQDELRRWAGEKIFNRGKGYIGQVRKLSCTEEGMLAAWVSGTKKYATAVYPAAGGEHRWSCTCPYDWGPCKHVVAVVLAAADQVRQGKTIPLLAHDDDLLRIVSENPENNREWLGDDGEPSEDSTAKRNQGKKRIQKILAGKSRVDLLDLVADLADHYPEIKRRIIETDQLEEGEIDKLVRALRLEIREVTSQPAWYDSWRNEGDLPDYSHIRDQLKALLAKGHADAVLKLGEELWREGVSQVEESRDEGDTAGKIAECMEVVLRALRQTSLTPPEQLLWLIDRMLEDDFSMLDSAEKILKGNAYNKVHWQDAACVLEVRLNSMTGPHSGDFSGIYRRKGILSFLLKAYEQSGWNEKVIPVLEKEADTCQCYEKLVDALLTAGDKDKARRWCIQGFAKTEQHTPGIAASLQDRLREMAESENRFDLAIAYRAQDFFENASMKTYTDLCKAARKNGNWPVIRDGILRYLETGQRPDRDGRGKEIETWPLPVPEVLRKIRRVKRFPDFSVLIDIAILEKRFDDVVRYYSALKNAAGCWGGKTDKTVAQAVVKTHPEVALDIWRAIVNSLIGQVMPKAYEEAAIYLRLMRETYERNNRFPEWQSLISGLRKKHKAKRRLLEVLDGLSQERNIE